MVGCPLKFLSGSQSTASSILLFRNVLKQVFTYSISCLQGIEHVRLLTIHTLLAVGSIIYSSYN